jgi:lipopolysaccharide export system protein LptC
MAHETGQNAMSTWLSRKRQDRITALFPLMAMALFALLTFWLDARISASAQDRKKSAPTAPDHFMQGFKIETTSPSGVVDQTLFGVRATHFPNNQTTVVEAPKFRSNVTGKPTMAVDASDALLVNDPKKKGIERIDFRGKVVAVQGATPGRDAIRYESETLTVFPETQRASTAATTKTISGDRVMVTQGIEIDAENQTGKTDRGFNLELKPTQ